MNLEEDVNYERLFMILNLLLSEKEVFDHLREYSIYLVGFLLRLLNASRIIRRKTITTAIKSKLLNTCIPIKALSDSIEASNILNIPP